MTRGGISIGLVLVALSTLPVAGQQDEPGIVRDFREKVDGYVALHRRLEANLPERKTTTEAWRIGEASDALAAAIRAARGHAKQGDIFVPSAERLFRMRVRMALARVDITAWLADLYEGTDFKSLHAEIHLRDPAGVLPRGLPISLQWALPELPSELEYRFIGRDLTLWDEHAMMVIDYVPDALPDVTSLRSMAD